MKNGRVSSGLVVGVAVGLLGTSGCHRGYIYGRDEAPVIEGRQLVIESRESEHVGRVERARTSSTSRTRTIRSISVALDGSPADWEPATLDDTAYLRAGALPPEVQAVKISVDNTETVWGDWALGGFGLGLTTTLGLFAAVAALSPDINRIETLDLGLTLLISVVIGLEFALIGAALGELFDGQDVDQRLGFD